MFANQCRINMKLGLLENVYSGDNKNREHPNGVVRNEKKTNDGDHQCAYKDDPFSVLCIIRQNVKRKLTRGRFCIFHFPQLCIPQLCISPSAMRIHMRIHMRIEAIEEHQGCKSER